MTQPGRLAVMMFAAVALLGCSDKKKLRAEYVAADKAVAAPIPPTHFALTTPDAKLELVLPARVDRCAPLTFADAAGTAAAGAATWHLLRCHASSANLACPRTEMYSLR